ncbi:MAG TPA: transcriptional repressor [Spirochaetota bacterium]|nr:transcriptional repressor [Spirochaetota bacterium]
MKLKRKRSRQRERILELIQASVNHPTAQAIHEILKKEIKSLSMGTVYRNIRILMEQGLIASRNFGDGVEHLDPITQSHYHFICNRCKSVSDFTMPFQESINKKAQKISKNTITGHTIQFYGICKKCKNQKKEDTDERDG